MKRWLPVRAEVVLDNILKSGNNKPYALPEKSGNTVPNMLFQLWFVLLLFLSSSVGAAGQALHTLDIQHLTRPRTDDLPQILQKQRTLRVLVPYSRTLYYVDRGRERGVTAERLREFERFANKTLKTGRKPLTVSIIPVTRARLLPDLLAGRGDIAAGNITVTPERAAQVAFSEAPDLRVKEVLASGPTAPSVAGIDSLAGLEIAVKQSSSFHDSLLSLNARFAAAGLPPVDIRLLPEDLETEDVLDMVAAGILPMTVIDAHIGRIWQPILKKLVLHEDIVLRDNAETAYALRQDNPELKALVDRFIIHNRDNGTTLERKFQQKARRVRQLANSLGAAEHVRFEQTIALFRHYGTQYGFNPLMLAAQGFQESRLNQQARSPVGAIGVMQLMPDTGREMRVGDIHQLEPNIHAGAKYMDLLMRRYFPKDELDAQTRALFAFASYNVGPGRMRSLRREAAKEGLDPNKWFDNVEIVASRRVGLEPILYVRNIYKYFVAYQLDHEGEERRRLALEQVIPNDP